MGAITRSAPEDINPMGATENSRDSISSDVTIEPGAMLELNPGEDLTFSKPPDVGSNQDRFMYRMLTAVCAGLGTPYFLATGDLREVSFSSMRLGMISFKRRFVQFQDHSLIFQFCRPLWKRWMDTAVLAGALKPRKWRSDQRSYYRASWLAQRVDWVDPKNDIQAEVLEISNGLKTRSQAVAERGWDIAHIDQEAASDAKRRNDFFAEAGVDDPTLKPAAPAAPDAKPEKDDSK